MNGGLKRGKIPEYCRYFDPTIDDVGDGLVGGYPGQVLSTPGMLSQGLRMSTSTDNVYLTYVG